VASPGAITQGHDANGFLVMVTDQSDSSRNREFVNDASGRALEGSIHCPSRTSHRRRD